MDTVSVLGSALPAACAQAIADAGLSTRRASVRDGEPCVVVTRDEAAVPPRRTAAWVWLCRGAVSLGAALEATRRGAYDVLSAEDADVAARLVERLRELLAPEPPVPVEPGIVARSAAGRMALRQAVRAAHAAVPVLLVGETGTGKEEMAKLIHRWSGRDGPWLPINCAAIPNELMESELFGHARGAFSGAIASVDGKLLAAQGGTAFLDEIDDTPPSVQAKLLRVLEEGRVTRVGETRSRPADFRLVAATNRDLLALAAEGRFGRDLYERLAIVRIDLPPLRERREDIAELAAYFIGRFYELNPRPERVRGLAPRALEALLAHGWPGNIRELRNVIFHALVMKRAGEEILLSDLPRLLRQPAAASAALAADAGVVDEEALHARLDSGSFNLRAELERLERHALRLALVRAGGSPARAARLLGEVGRGTARDPGGTVRAMMRRLGVA